MMSGPQNLTQQTLTQQTLAQHTARTKAQGTGVIARSAGAASMANSRTVAFTALNPKQHVLAANATVLWEASVYGGTGAERRLNLVLKVSDQTLAAFQAIEDATIGPAPQHLTLCSVIREDTIRCKIDLDELRYWDHNNDRTIAPDPLKGRIVQAYIEVRGTWNSRTNTGLSAICTDIQLSGEAAPAVSPFGALLGALDTA
jgi:hypothetical protein